MSKGDLADIAVVTGIGAGGVLVVVGIVYGLVQVIKWSWGS